MKSYRVQYVVTYGLAFRLGLLPTPSLDDAVSSGYGQPVLCPKRTFTSQLSRALRRTKPALTASKTEAEVDLWSFLSRSLASNPVRAGHLLDAYSGLARRGGSINRV